MGNKMEASLTKEIFIECSPRTLFSFFTDGDKMVKWMGRQILMEPSVGGNFHIDIDGDHIAKGEYVEIVPYEKIVMTWGWKDSEIMPPGSSKVEFNLIPEDSGTLLVLHHYDLPEEKKDSNQQGWTHYMNRLQQLATGHDPGIDPWTEPRGTKKI